MLFFSPDFSIHESVEERLKVYYLNCDNVSNFWGEDKNCRGMVKGHHIFGCSILHFYKRNDSCTTCMVQIN